MTLVLLQGDIAVFSWLVGVPGARAQDHERFADQPALAMPNLDHPLSRYNLPGFIETVPVELFVSQPDLVVLSRFLIDSAAGCVHTFAWKLDDGRDVQFRTPRGTVNDVFHTEASTQFARDLMSKLNKPHTTDDIARGREAGKTKLWLARPYFAYAIADYLGSTNFKIRSLRNQREKREQQQHSKTDNHRRPRSHASNQA